jgi:protein-L-isoaspartate(D-aspartate) O-methyltransferase
MPDRDEGKWKRERAWMVDAQIVARGVADERVLDAMRRVPRHLFVPEPLRFEAYEDHPIAIGEGQTISQPYIVALMLELARISPGDRVLEVGVGSGYVAAVMAAMGAHVFGLELVPSLAARATHTLAELGYAAEIRCADGYAGWAERAPFDAIVLSAAPPTIPKRLCEELAIGGRLVAPEGTSVQELVVVERRADGFHESRALYVQFVPMVGTPV